MQLMPPTARMLGVNDSFDPAENIEAGVKYLKYLQDLYKDDRLALAAYNAGPGAVDRFKQVPPYPETQKYVEKVGKKYGDARSAAARKLPQPAPRPSAATARSRAPEPDPPRSSGRGEASQVGAVCRRRWQIASQNVAIAGARRGGGRRARAPAGVVSAEAVRRRREQPAKSHRRNGADTGKVTAVRFWSLGDVTRISIEVSSDFKYRSDRLPDPDRLFFDIQGARPAHESKKACT